MSEYKYTDPFKEAVRNKIPDRIDFADKNDELWAKVFNEIKTETETKEKSYFSWYVAAAAVVLVSLTAVLSFYFFGNDSVDNIIANDSHLIIKEKAEAVAESEVKTDSEIQEKSVENNVNTTVEAAPQVVSEPFANAKKIEANESLAFHLINILPDGSSVLLNQRTEILVADNFATNRNIKLEGEAYFQVDSDKNNPFSVLFGDYKLIVVGTKFNVRNYNSENFKEITVIEGIVKVSGKNLESEIELREGEQLRISNDNNAEKAKVEAGNYISWRTRNFNFRRTRLTEVAKLLNRTYKEQVILAPEINNCTFTGDLEGLPFEDAIQIIAMTTSLKIEKKKNKLYLSGPACE